MKKLSISAATLALDLWSGAAGAATIVSYGIFELGTSDPGLGSFATIPG